MLCDMVNTSEGSVRTRCLYRHPKTEAGNSTETLVSTIVHGIIFQTTKLLPLTAVSIAVRCAKHSNVTINFTSSDVEDTGHM
jgi:hypothetical protein